MVKKRIKVTALYEGLSSEDPLLWEAHFEVPKELIKVFTNKLARFESEWKNGHTRLRPGQTPVRNEVSELR